jgi:structural maintenance of chromosome 3 (chondroitin sulfate proteoglycan 6)
MSAYVEIIFDNSDERFMTKQNEVIIRRTIGLKKDEYSLDRKSATKTDVMNLLESAGFSRSNPYYIVPQGRVTALTNMKDPDRLLLLKEIAGTQVYEQRRGESIKIMDETKLKKEKIDDLLRIIEERLRELDSETKELKEFQANDREKRCLEYTIYHREQMEINTALEQIEEGRARGAENNDEAREAYREREAQISDVERDLTKARNDVKLRRTERQQLSEEQRIQLRNKAALELGVKDYADNQSNRDKSRKQHKADIAAVEREIKSNTQQLDSLIPEYEKRKAKETEIRNEYVPMDWLHYRRMN